jgi:branched-chain amino acid transport system substrate-binding protein
MKRFWLVLAIMAVLAIGIAPAVIAQECDDAIGCVVIGADDPVVLATMFTVSGPTASLGLDSLGGVQIAILEREGTVLDHEIVLVEEDTLCSAEGGQAAAQRIAADSTVLGIIGTSCSSEAVAGLPIISEAGMLMISPSNTSPRLTNADTATDGVWLPGYYRTAHNDLFQGAIAAIFALDELGATTLATIHDGSPYADGLQGVMADTFTELGGEVTFQGAVNVGDTDMTAILTEIAANPPDVLYFPIFEPESNFIAAQAASIPGLEETILMSADGSYSPTFAENTGDAALGMYFSGPYIPADNEDYIAFLEAWDAEIGGVPPSGFHAHAYDATNILLDAIEAVAVVGDDGSLSVGRQALRDYLDALEGYAGLTGTLSCGETGDCATGEALAVYQLSEAEISEGNWPPPVVWVPTFEDEAEATPEATEAP